MIFRDLKTKWRAPRSVKADSSHPEPEADLGDAISAGHALVILTDKLSEPNDEREAGTGIALLFLGV